MFSLPSSDFQEEGFFLNPPSLLLHLVLLHTNGKWVIWGVSLRRSWAWVAETLLLPCLLGPACLERTFVPSCLQSCINSKGPASWGHLPVVIQHLLWLEAGSLGNWELKAPTPNARSSLSALSVLKVIFWYCHMYSFILFLNWVRMWARKWDAVCGCSLNFPNNFVLEFLMLLFPAKWESSKAERVLGFSSAEDISTP